MKKRLSEREHESSKLDSRSVADYDKSYGDYGITDKIEELNKLSLDVNMSISEKYNKMLEERKI